MSTKMSSDDAAEPEELESEIKTLIEEVSGNLQRITEPQWLVYEKTDTILTLLENLGNTVGYLTEEIIYRENAYAKASDEAKKTSAGRAYDALAEVLKPENLSTEQLEDLLLLFEYLGTAVYRLAEEVKRRRLVIL